MRILSALLLFSLCQMAGASETISCECEQGILKVKLEIEADQVLSIKTYKDLPMRSIAEFLPAGIYQNTEDINEQLNWHFGKEASLYISPIMNSNIARLQVIGQDVDKNSRLVVFSKTLNCQHKFHL